MGFQVIISIGFDGEGFWVKKSSQEPFEIAIFAWNSGIEAILALLTNFLTKITPKFPQIRTDHVVGPHM